MSRQLLLDGNFFCAVYVQFVCNIDETFEFKKPESSSGEPHLRTTGCHLPYGTTQYYTCHPTQVNTPRLNHS